MNRPLIAVPAAGRAVRHPHESEPPDLRDGPAVRGCSGQLPLRGALA
jgi:hypothetical protein